MIEARTASLTSTLIRRAPLFAVEAPVRLALSSGLAEDIRTFALTWAAGFAFFMAFVI